MTKKKKNDTRKRAFLREYEDLCRNHGMYVDLRWPKCSTDNEPNMEVTIGLSYLDYHISILTDHPPYLMENDPE